MLLIKYISTICEYAPRWKPRNMFDAMSSLDQVMAWCCQATNHYLNRVQWLMAWLAYTKLQIQILNYLLFNQIAQV